MHVLSSDIAGYSKHKPEPISASKSISEDEPDTPQSPTSPLHCKKSPGSQIAKLLKSKRLLNLFLSRTSLLTQLMLTPTQHFFMSVQKVIHVCELIC